jgi:hypothetical protein
MAKLGDLPPGIDRDANVAIVGLVSHRGEALAPARLRKR